MKIARELSVVCGRRAMVLHFCGTVELLDTERNLTEVHVGFLDAIVMTLMLEVRHLDYGAPDERQ